VTLKHLPVSHAARAFALLWVVAFAAPPLVANADILSGFTDPTDAQFDVGDWLLNKRGVLFNPILITEPAVGYGAGGTLMFFHKKKDDEERAKSGEELGLPPSISFAVGFGTENGTWAAGGGHFASWRQDSLRYMGAVGYTSTNMDFYLADQPLGYNLKGVFLVQEMSARILGSPVFVGGRYVYAHLDPSFDNTGVLPPSLLNRTASNLGGLGLNLFWDTRDNLLDPTDGEFVHVLPVFFGPWMGGDDWFQLLTLKARTFQRLHERFNVNLRADARLSFMDTPFYSLPRIQLRGVSQSRYQGTHAGEAEIEARWRAWKRWSLIGFFGVGWTEGSKFGLMSSSHVVPAGGGGFRYLIARQLGLNMGMDFAGSENKFAFYFQVGSVWR